MVWSSTRKTLCFRIGPMWALARMSHGIRANLHGFRPSLWEEYNAPFLVANFRASGQQESH
jgi:hypothetical protein